jgi:endonuclease/exonuclease/phosphatase family metal-dependent hydrolase
MAIPKDPTATLSVRVLTWNVDMSTEHPLERARAMVSIIKSQHPPIDVIMLQEMTSVVHEEGAAKNSHMSLFRERLEAAYHVHASEEWVRERNYYAVIFTRKGLFTPGAPVQVTYHSFEGSIMERGYVLVDGLSASAGRLTFITSHLESETIGAVERKNQFAEIIRILRERADGDHVVIFGGDTNLREGEISSAVIAKKPVHELKERERERAKGDLPTAQRKISDAYIQAGADEKKKFTWDMKRNDNLKVDWEFRPASRYDRVFVFGPTARYPVCTNWDLVGRERLECSVFPSDHWGVLVDIQVPLLPSPVIGASDGKEPEPVKAKSPDTGRAKKRRKVRKTEHNA